jgi:hypothetical protein
MSDAPAAKTAPLELTNAELSFLSVLMEASYSFITTEERIARQTLREKIKAAAMTLLS